MIGQEVQLFIFHRDLRLVDHYGLLEASKNKIPVLPIFIFTPEQVMNNPLKSNNSVQFMLQSLKELNTQLRQKHTRLIMLYGDSVKMLESLKKELNIVAITETKDYTPYAKKREAAIKKFCDQNNIKHTLVHDLYLTTPGSIRTGSNKVFQKFTPYYEMARKVKIPKPSGVSNSLWYKPKASAYHNEISIVEAYKKFLPKLNDLIAVKGGRAEALHLLKNLPIDYDKIRDCLAKKTSMMSAHNHFGTVSIREVYWRAKELSPTKMEGYIRQLFWRDFNGSLMEFFEELYNEDPYEFEGKASLRGKSDDSAKKKFELWKKGETGHDLVDAAMKQLVNTGYMHNRARMVVASYLVKDCHVYWRWGERFFAKNLVDYDPAQNMMNWVGTSSLAPFGSAPFRRHDPEVTEKRLDPKGEYVDTWLQ